MMSAIHQDGMLKSKDTYEIISPEEIGLVRKDEAGIVMGTCVYLHAWQRGQGFSRVVIVSDLHVCVLIHGCATSSI